MNNNLSRQYDLNAFWWVFVVLAVLIFSYQYAINRSLWLDESRLALNIRERSFAELLEPLDYNQAAPVGFLLTTKLITTLLGNNEFTLRLFPYLMGLATLWLYYRVGREISPRTLLFGFALLSTSWLHIRYATEFKQYMGDGVFALLITGLALRVLRQPTSRHIAHLGAAGCLAVWFSHPVIFVLAGVGSVLLIDALYKRDWITTRKLALMGALQVMSFAAVYWLAYRNVAQGTSVAQHMNDYWQSAFLRPDIVSFVQVILELFLWVGGTVNWIFLIVVVFGFILGLLNIERRVLALLLSPLIFMALASLLELYPLNNRFWLFILPSMIFIVAVGWSTALAQIRDIHPHISRAATVLLLIAILIRLDVPYYVTEIRDAFEWIYSINTGRDRVFVTFIVGDTAIYYGYYYELLTADLPDTGRYWIIIQEDPPEMPDYLPENKIAYDSFPGLIVLCIPNEANCLH